MHLQPQAGFRLQEATALAPLTTFGIGGPARWFARVETEAELLAACRWSRERQAALFVLGGGSNVLVSDRGFDGLVLQIGLRGIVEQQGPGGKRLFQVAAGEDWDALVTRTVEQGCGGMECLAGIPGLVGGTPVQNVGAYGQEVAQTITELRCFDREAGEFLQIPAADCGFGYRTSRFNTDRDRGRFIVTEVTFALTPGGAPSLEYADVKKLFAERAAAPSLAEVAEAVRAIRRAKGMVVDPVPFETRDPDQRSAGSYFKNPIVPESLYAALAASFAPRPVPSYPAPAGAAGDAQRKLPAAWLLEQAGFPRGFALEGAAVSSRHTLALTNHSGHATADEVLALQRHLQSGVAQRFGVMLEPEPVFVGEP